MEKHLSEIINKYNALNIENALVQLFLENHNIVVKKNILIRKIAEDVSLEVLKIKKELSDVFKYGKIEDFINIFERMIPDRDKNINGAFFTPQLITDYMASETITDARQKICDPSCGCGAFLIAAAKRLRSRFGAGITYAIENNLFGVDIAPYSIRRAKILLTLLALQNGEDKKEIRFNLVCKNSLVSEIDNIFSTQFDVVIGNPPYVKFQDLDSGLRRRLSADWQTLNVGNFNLYFAFFEIGIKMLKKDGILSYITPNNYFTSLAAISLRKYLSSQNLIKRILDFNHLKIFDAQTYTCITFLQKHNKKYFDFDRVDHYDGLNKLNKLKYSKILFSSLNNNKWRLLKREDQKNIKKIESAGEKLKNLADIHVGIATCKDAVYFVDGSTLTGGFYHKKSEDKTYKIEKRVTKPIVKISDFKNQKTLDANNRRIIFPYEKINGKFEIIPEKKFKNIFPFCYEYLCSKKHELNLRDKGNTDYPEWYAYARSQGLNFFGEKLLTPTFSSEPRFLFEHNNDALFCNGYAVYLKDNHDLFNSNAGRLNLAVLKKILNSHIMDYYIKKTSVSIEGGYPCYQKNFIETFNIPYLSTKEIDFLEKENDSLKIDIFLKKKYGIHI